MLRHSITNTVYTSIPLSGQAYATIYLTVVMGVSHGLRRTMGSGVPGHANLHYGELPHTLSSCGQTGGRADIALCMEWLCFMHIGMSSRPSVDPQLARELPHVQSGMTHLYTSESVYMRNKVLSCPNHNELGKCRTDTAF